MNKIIYIIHDFLLILYAIIIKIVLLRFSSLNKIPPTKKDTKTIIVVNGPSLKKDIKKILAKKKDFEFYAVNYFATSEEFKLIKPNFYAFADPIYWRSDVNKNFKRDNSKLFKALCDVNWNMYLLCPNEGVKIISKKLERNKNITIIPIKTNFFHFKNEKLNLFALKYDIASPIFINVLIVALWNAIKRKVSYVEIYGADFSAFKELSIDQKTNQLGSDFTHFYKNTKAQAHASKKYPKTKVKKIHNRLYQIWSSFYQMYLLSNLAKKNKIKVINCSSNSYLDTFERSK